MVQNRVETWMILADTGKWGHSNLWCPNNIWRSVKYICASIHMHYFFYFIGTASASASALLMWWFLMYFMRQERQNRSKSDTKTIDSISAVKLWALRILRSKSCGCKTEAVPPLTYGRTSIDKHVGLYFVWEKRQLLCVVWVELPPFVWRVHFYPRLCNWAKSMTCKAGLEQLF